MLVPRPRALQPDSACPTAAAEALSRLVLIVGLWALGSYGFAETTIDQLPVYECRVERSQGTFMGYLPPKPGDEIVLDLKALQKSGDKLQFLSGNYIPLNGVFNLTGQERGAEGQLATQHWRSGAVGEWGVALDLRLSGGPNPSGARVTVMQQEQRSMSSAELACTPQTPAGAVKPR